MKTPSSLHSVPCTGAPQASQRKEADLKEAGRRQSFIPASASALSVPRLAPGALEWEPPHFNPAPQELRLTGLSDLSPLHPQCGLSYARGQS